MEPHRSLFPMSPRIPARPDVCGSLLGITSNIHHPYCQRHGEISLDSKALLSRKALSCGSCKIFWSAGAHFSWGSCLVTHYRLIWSFCPDHYAIGREMRWTTSSHTFQRLFVMLYVCVDTAQQVKLLCVSNLRFDVVNVCTLCPLCDKWTVIIFLWLDNWVCEYMSSLLSVDYV